MITYPKQDKNMHKKKEITLSPELSFDQLNYIHN